MVWVDELTTYCEDTARVASSAGFTGFNAKWFSLKRREQWQNALHDAYSIADVSKLILQYESYIVAERLDKEWLRHREQWKYDVLQCDAYAEIQAPIESLKSAIMPPPFFAQALRSLIEAVPLLKAAPLDVSMLLLSFVFDEVRIQSTVNALPIVLGSQGEENIIRTSDLNVSLHRSILEWFRMSQSTYDHFSEIIQSSDLYYS